MAEQQPPALMDELVEEIVLRVPPDEPEMLMRAAVACKPWCRLFCEPRFSRRFREHHGSPPLLGIVKNCIDEHGDSLVRFIPTGSFRPPVAELVDWAVLDSRHGRVLLRSSFSEHHFSVAVWDPMTDELLELPATPWMLPEMYNYKGAVLCAGDGCDHLDCHGKPFLVVFLGVAAFYDNMTSYVYSSETNAWSELAHDQFFGRVWQWVSCTLVENALYFLVNTTPIRILKYNLATREATAISPPPMKNLHIALMNAEGGGLGCATMTLSKLCLWSAEVGPNGDIGWALGKTIELSTLVPAGHFIREFDVATSANGGGIIHVVTKKGYQSFITNLKTGNLTELKGTSATLVNMVPYMSFYTPALKVASTENEDPRAGEPLALSSLVIKNLAPEALSDEGLPRKKKLVDAIEQSKATKEDKEAKEKANKSIIKQQ